MAHSIKRFINLAIDKSKRRKVYIQIISNKKVYRIPTEAYADQKGKLDKINIAISDQKEIELRDIIQKAIVKGVPITKELLLGKRMGDEMYFTAYIAKMIEEELKGVLSDARIKHYKVLQNKISDFDSELILKDIDVNFMNKFTSYLLTKGHKEGRGLDSVSANSKISILIAIINRAIAAKLLPVDCIKGYRRPKSEKKYPTYLTIEEIELIRNEVERIPTASKRTSGYYFLLACYAGYRISDLYAFDYDKMVQGDVIRLRAEKNGKFVTMPIHDKLKSILSYIKKTPINKIPQQHMRDYIKRIAEDVGINKDIKIHSGRHSFASILVTNGLSLHQVAHYLGDGKDAAAIYAHLVPNSMDDKVRDIFKQS